MDTLWAGISEGGGGGVVGEGRRRRWRGEGRMRRGRGEGRSTDMSSHSERGRWMGMVL